MHTDSMSFNFRRVIGLGGVPPHDSVPAYHWEKRLHWPMLAVTLLTLPAFYLGEMSEAPRLLQIGHWLDLGILTAFVLELVVMLGLVRQRLHYLAWNWLMPAIIAATALSLLLPWLPTELASLLRLLRLTIAGLLFARLAHSFRLLTPGSTPYILMIGFTLMLLSGGGFYWLEPSVRNYWDGVWLAFESGLTVGYGDIVPTTHAARIFAGLVIVLTYAVMSLVTASIAAFFIGKEEKRLRMELHQDLKSLRREIAELRTQLDKGKE